MALSETGDPRLQELFGPEAAAAAGIKPVVRLPRSGPSGWVIAAFALAAAILLFWLLESRRESQPEPEVRLRGDAATFSTQPPPLYIPPVPQPQQQVAPVTAPSPAPAEVRPQVLPQDAYETPLPEPVPAPAPAQESAASSGPALVIDTTAPVATPPAGAGAVGPPALNPQWGGRARASTLANRSNTVAQGALIPAVLETAFNSTSAGLARAIVSRDVRGFDGKKVLIPRGSRLIGEYSADAAPGQNRASITWTRLVRPDGVTIALDSPATDTLGRGGVRASVNTHFWTRLGDAVLGSAASIGTALGTRAATGTVILSVPGSVPQSPIVQSNGITPTLSVPAGTSISVFVARDLEFPPGTNG